MAKNSTTANRYIFCNRCRGETEHKCIAEQFRDFPNYDDDGGIIIVERQGYRLWVCSGCKTGTLQEYYIFDITLDDYQDEKMWDVNYYPARNKMQIALKGFIQLPSNLNKIYRETLGAFNNNLTVLCALGIRALLEGICADKEIEGSNLRSKIDNMVTILPENIVENLHSIRFIGNEAAHRLSAPSLDELRLAIELCEDLLNYIYELDYKAKRLNASRKARKEQSRKSTKGKASTK